MFRLLGVLHPNFDLSLSTPSTCIQDRLTLQLKTPLVYVNSWPQNQGMVYTHLNTRQSGEYKCRTASRTYAYTINIQHSGDNSGVYID